MADVHACSGDEDGLDRTHAAADPVDVVCEQAVVPIDAVHVDPLSNVVSGWVHDFASWNDIVVLDGFRSSRPDGSVVDGRVRCRRSVVRATCRNPRR